MKNSTQNDAFNSTKMPSVSDLNAYMFWGANSSQTVWKQIRQEKQEGKRDQYFIPISYNANLNNSHFDDRSFEDRYQKDVYLLARMIMDTMNASGSFGKRKGRVIDIGCGSGYKLVKYIASADYDTIGTETEPALSYLRTTYPRNQWFDAGSPEETLQNANFSSEGLKPCDLGVSADVIEHVKDPDLFMDYLVKLRCSIYVISTPRREVMVLEGPPSNGHHIREWTFQEFQVYLMSHGFELLQSYQSVVLHSAQYHAVRLQ